MDIELLKKYLYELEGAYYIDNYGKKRAQSVHGNSFSRMNTAKAQAKLDPVNVNEIANLVKGFLNDVGIFTIDDPILKPCEIDYQKIQEEFKLNDRKDIIWMKFTTDGYLGVVAVSDDKNFDMPPKHCNNYDEKKYNPYTGKCDWVYNTSGIIVRKLNKEWDKSFLLVFPLCGIPLGYTRKDLEKAVGNFLIEKNVPILDFYSHIY